MADRSNRNVGREFAEVKRRLVTFLWKYSFSNIGNSQVVWFDIEEVLILEISGRYSIDNDELNNDGCVTGILSPAT